LTAETTRPGWRTNFYLQTGICALLVIGAVFIVPGRLLPRRKESSSASDNNIDYIGALLSVSGLVLFAFALADGSGAEKGWRTPYIPTFLAVGALLMAGFLVWEWYVENRTDKTPLMRLSIWKKGKFAVLQLAGFLLFGAFTT
jgi:MFS family permease